MRHPLLTALALAVCASLSRAQGFMQVADGNASQMTLKSHLVSVVLDNQVASTTVDQVFVNPNSVPVEAIYLFPVPDGASMSKLSMWINGEEQEAELLESGKARSVYENIVRARRDPALLEFAGAKTFRLRVFPIAPGEEKRVKLSYSEVLKAEGGVAAYRYRLSTAKFSKVALAEVRVSVKIVSNVAIKSIVSPTHAVDVARPDDHHATAAYEAVNTAPDRDFQLFIAAQDGDFGMNLIAQREAGEDGYFMLMLAPKVTAKAEAIRRDVCFVLDTSMSMQDEERITQAKKALKAGFQTLDPGDRFNVVSFSTEVRAWKSAVVSATDANVAEASAYVDSLRARGATNIEGALQAVFEMAPGDPARPYLVLFMTDGAPTIGETEPENLLTLARTQNKAGARLFTLGVGFDLDVRLLDRLAEENHGVRQYVTPTESLETRMAAFYEKFSAPVLSDAKLEIDGAGVEIYDVYPKQLSDVFKGQQISVFGRFKEAGSRKVKLTGKVNGEAREYSWTADFPAGSTDHDAVPRLWAVSKVGFLLDAVRLNGEKEELKKEIMALAREFGIVTPYTSYLVLEDDARVAAGNGGGERFGGASGGRRNERKGVPDANGAPSFPDPASGDHNESDNSAMMKGDDTGNLAPRGRGVGRAEALGVGGGSGGVRASREADGMKSGRGGDSKEAKRVGEKTFYQGHGIWQDADWTVTAELVKVEYLSDEYFKLTADKPELAKYLAIGEHVRVMFEGKAYEIVPAAAK